jgi:hypothetical protein
LHTIEKFGLDGTLAAIAHTEKPQVSPAPAAKFIKNGSNISIFGDLATVARVLAAAIAPHAFVS